MKKLSILIISLFLVYACGNSSEDPKTTDILSSNGVNGDPVYATELNADMNVLIADNFCANETKLKLLSTSLLSAYHEKSSGNSTDPNYCGGSSTFTENGDKFGIELSDYCVNFRGQEVLINGSIDGITDSGSNFFSTQVPDITIQGSGYDISFSGKTWYGRADDMFVQLTVTDNTTGNTLVLDETNIKKGEFDIGWFSIGGVGPYEFRFTRHFNAELTDGELFIYGAGEEYLILTAEQGIVTVVFKRDRHAQGILVNSSCSS